MQDSTSKAAELEVFYNELVEYEKWYQRFLKGERITRVEKAQLGQLYEDISRKVGSLGSLITQLTGIDKVDVHGKEYDMWLIALKSPMDKLAYSALGVCIQVINRAIGRLADDIQRGYRDKNGNVIGKPPEATEDYEGRSAPKELELILEGTPDMIIECIMDFVKKLNSEGYAYKCTPKIGDAPDYAKWDKTYSASCAFSLGDEGQIGTIKLQLLPKERTLFKIPEPEDWDSPFGEFISHLLAEFKRLEFVFFEEEKPPLGFKPPHKEKDV